MLEQLFGSKTRVRILRLFLNNPSQPYYLRELTRKLKSQLNSVRREINNLGKMGIIKSVKPAEDKEAKEASMLIDNVFLTATDKKKEAAE